MIHKRQCSILTHFYNVCKYFVLIRIYSVSMLINRGIWMTLMIPTTSPNINPNKHSSKHPHLMSRVTIKHAGPTKLLRPVAPCMPLGMRYIARSTSNIFSHTREHVARAQCTSYSLVTQPYAKFNQIPHVQHCKK